MSIPLAHEKTTKNSFVFQTRSDFNVDPRSDARALCRGRMISRRFSLRLAIVERNQTMSESELYELRPSVPIIRVFRARAKQGCDRALADKLATSSIDVVQAQPGFLGYLIAGPAIERQHEF